MTYYKTNFILKCHNLPFFLISIIILINMIGFIALWSAAGGNMHPWAINQITKFLIFFPIAIFIALMDSRIILKISYLVYFAVLFLLFGVELFGTHAKGAERWIDLGIVKLQPSEPAKIAIVLMLSKYFHNLKATEVGEFYQIFLAVIAVIIPVILIIKQPDLGTGIITIIVAASIFFAAGIRLRIFVISGFIMALSLPIIWQFMYEYQRKRIQVFLNPELDPLGAGYNIIQSKIAIGSGGLFGKGLTKGTQSHLDFLPEHQTDFIFATLTEETGFFGGMILLALYSLILFICIGTAINCKTMFNKLVVIGIASIFFSHIFINIAMVMGFVPGVGVPLPFVSYGGTMMASMLIGFGLIMNSYVHQYNRL